MVLTVKAGSLLGAEGFSTNEFPDGSSTTMVKGSSLSTPALMSASFAITPAIWAPTYVYMTQGGVGTKKKRN